MEDVRKFSIKERINSFKYAFNGFKYLLKDEHNARIHLLITIFVILLSIYFRISNQEWIMICFAIGLVFVSEILNTAIEKLADKISTEFDINIKKAKDLGAAAVLFSAIIAVIIGALIFVPYILNLFE